MTDWKGLWSYVHKDDEADSGRVCQLARDVAMQFEMETGESIELFLDADAIEWGDHWRDKIDEGLASIAFFIPVLTPRYFQSAECRRELQSFARRADRLGVKELVLPLLYVDVAGLHEEEPSDDLIALIRTFQWEDWTALRFAEASSGSYRNAVSDLAKRLVRANVLADEADQVVRAHVIADPEMDESPGLIDSLAEMESAFPRLTETLEAISEQIKATGEIATQGAADIDHADARGKGFAGRLAIARRVSGDLSGPAEGIWADGNTFASLIHTVDQGMRLLIDRIPAEVEQNPDDLPEACEFFKAVRDLATATQEGLSSIENMVDTMAPLETMSRDMRPPLKRMRQGFTVMLEAREVAEEWVRLIDAAGLDCDEE